MSEKQEKPILYRILTYAPFSFVLGCIMTATLILFPFVLLAGSIILAIFLYAFRDRIDFDELLGRSPKKEPLKPCPGCGSTTKHKKNCPEKGKKIG